MPESARILRFPTRLDAADVSRQEASRRASEYLTASLSDRCDDFRARLIADPETMLCLIASLRVARDARPEEIAEEGASLYAWLSASKGSFARFDEGDYFLGEIALITGGAFRLLGKRDPAELWLDRADACFRHTLNPGPALAMTAYARLALRFDMRRYEEVLELLPSLVSSFKKFKMWSELVKCHLLAAVTLKESGRTIEALTSLLELTADPNCSREPAVLGVALVNLGDLQSSQADLAGALVSYQRAASVLENADRPFIVAHLKGTIGQTLRAQGNVPAAVSAFREAAAEYSALGMTTLTAYMRVITAESLLALGRNREAEFEIFSALPVIDQEKMIPEARAALELLRESARQKNLDTSALTEVRNHLRAC